MKIGYACMCLHTADTKYRTCTKRYASPEKLREIITWNLSVLSHILRYNVQHDIRLYRFSSDLIPFGSSPINTLNWQQEFREELAQIGAYIRQHNLRVSLHPGQYSVLNSPNPDVVARTIEDLSYHSTLLDLMELDASHKLILHVGGVYGDKIQAMKRFIEQANKLSESIRRRLTIENDDHYYAIDEVLSIAEAVHLPVIFDTLHHQILSPLETHAPLEWLDMVHTTWKETDGIMKIHYSEQAPCKRIGAHADTVSSYLFHDFLKTLGNRDMDIMLEVKDKNLSAIKCNDIAKGCLHNPTETIQRYQYIIPDIAKLLSLPVAELYAYIDRQQKHPYDKTECMLLFERVQTSLVDVLHDREKKRMQAWRLRLKQDPSSYPLIIEALLGLLNKKGSSCVIGIYPLLYLTQLHV